MNIIKSMWFFVLLTERQLNVYYGTKEKNIEKRIKKYRKNRKYEDFLIKICYTNKRGNSGIITKK